MAKPLQSASIAAPGFYGLNTQESSVTLAAGFALQADNCVIDKFGRLGARKGWQVIADSVSNLQGAHRFLDINGTEYFGCWNDTGFYIYDGSAVLQPVSYIGANTITEGNWQAATLNDAAFLFQSGYKPVYFSPTAGTIDDVENVTNAFVPEANTVLSAYGRLWAANTVDNKTTVWWSDLLDGTDFQTGTSGSVDISSVLVNGNDRIVALGAQNGQLIIFCERNIIIYENGPSSISSGSDNLDPAEMQLTEVISGVGCVARDSVQNTGTDILFLSGEGLRSLGRVIQEKSLPMRDITKNVRDDLVREVDQHDKATIKSVYSPTEAFYLLLLPEFKRMYCVDMRGALQDGSSRVTLWDNQVHSNMMSVDDGLYFTNNEGLCRYYGYTDNGSSYVIKYYTNYFDFGDSTRQKMLKRLSITLIGGSGQDIVLKVGYDYDDSYRSFPISIAAQANAEYGEAKYDFPYVTFETYGLSFHANQTLSTDLLEDGYSLVRDVSTNKYWVANISEVATTEYTEAISLYKNTFFESGGFNLFSFTEDSSSWELRTVYARPEPTEVYEYSTGTLSDSIRAPVGGSGGVLQVGFEATIIGSELSIQKLDIYTKEGRVY